MKERGFRMYDHEVRAVLAGTKTQTRRIVKRQPPAHVTGIHELRRRTTTGSLPLGCWEWLNGDQPAGVEGVRCPYGQPGDRLWVRETARRSSLTLSNGSICRAIHYQADNAKREDVRVLGWRSGGGDAPWRPSIHMPRWASRITLEITEVCVARLNEISEEDTRAEGVDAECYPDMASMVDGYRRNFRRLWESINGPGSWAANPWVWVVSFRRLP